MSFFAGFSGEFGRQLATARAEEAAKAERQSALESSILQHLATSTDPEIQSHALTGLLDLAGPQKRAGGFAGWLGKMADHPALPTIRQLISSGRQVEDKGPEAPRMNVEEGLMALPGERVGEQPAPASRPLIGPPGPDDPEPQSALTPPPSALATASAFKSGFQPATTKTVPRQLFDTPEQVAEKTARGTTRGTLQGKVDVLRGQPGQPGQSPLTEEEQELLFPGKAMISAGTIQGKDTPYGSVDNAGRPLNPTGYYTTKADPRDPSKVVYFPSTEPAHVANQAAINKRQSFRQYAGPDGKTPAVWRVSRDGSTPAEFVGYVPQRGSYLAYVDEDTGLVTYQQAPAPMTSVPKTPAAPGGGTTITPPPQAGAPAAAAQPPGGATSPSAPPAVAPARAGAPPPGAASPAGIPGGRKRALQQTEGAYVGAGGEPVVGRALFDSASGKYYAVEDPAREAVGFIPGPEGAAVVQNYHQINSTLIKILAAKKQLEDKGWATNNDPKATAKLAADFYAGVLGDNQLDAAVASLTNLAALQGASQYVKSNSRSWQMFQTASVHLPRMPDERAAQLSQLPVVGGAVNPTTAGIAGSHGWDSPAQMYHKLTQAEEILKADKVSLAQITGKTPDRAVGAGGGPPSQGPAGTTPPPARSGGRGGQTAPRGDAPKVGDRRMIGGQLGEWDGQGWRPIR